MSIVQTDDDTLLQEGQAAASGAALAGGVWKSPLTPTDEQVAALKDMQSYQVLKTYIKEQAINVRGCLSHHVRCAHLPDVYHLKKRGLDDRPLRIHEEGMVAIKLYIPNAFQAGDGQFIDYTSGPHRNKSQAQEEACLEILALLLAVAPRNLITTVNQWRDGQKVVCARPTQCATRDEQLYISSCHPSSLWRRLLHRGEAETISPPTAMQRPLSERPMCSPSLLRCRRASMSTCRRQ